MSITKILSVYLLLIGLSAVGGGINLLLNNGGGLPVELLANTPFTNYFWPGIILLIVVGGTHFLAALSLWIKHTYTQEITAVAGFGLLIWIFTQVCMIGGTHWLQVLYFGLGLLTVVISLVLLRCKEVIENRN